MSIVCGKEAGKEKTRSAGGGESETTKGLTLLLSVINCSLHLSNSSLHLEVLSLLPLPSSSPSSTCK